MGVFFIAYPVLSFSEYPYMDEPYANAFAVCAPNALLKLDPTVVIVSYFFRANLSLDDTAPCTPNCGLFGL